MISDVSGVELELADGKQASVNEQVSELRGWPLDNGIELEKVETNPLRNHVYDPHPSKLTMAEPLFTKFNKENSIHSLGSTTFFTTP